MGYILPITNFTYQDYQKRDIKEPENPHYISKPFKVIMDIKYRELIQKHESDALMEKEHVEKEAVIINLARRDYINSIETKLTGKGIKINEYV